MVFTLPAILNVTALTFLFYFIESILTWFLYGSVRTQFYITSFANFNNFYESFVLLFRMSTGENWFGVMFDCGRTRGGGNKYSEMYFIVFIVVQQYIMLNLFVLIIIN